MSKQYNLYQTAANSFHNPQHPMPAPNDLASRVSALENSEELRDIYRHPYWTKLMELTRSANNDYSRQCLKVWAESHYQLAPLISWFHSCTLQYGLSFDIYRFVPLSRLLIEERCRERIDHYNRLLNANQRSVRFYENMLDSIRSASNPHVTHRTPTESRLSSCWSVLSDCSDQLGISISDSDAGRSPEWMNESPTFNDPCDLTSFALPPSSYDL